MTEEIRADLFDPAKKDNQKTVNLFDDGRWRKLIDEYDGGQGRPLGELLDELMEGR